MASKRPFSATDLLFLSSDLSLSQETHALARVLLARLCGEHKYTIFVLTAESGIFNIPLLNRNPKLPSCVCSNLNKKEEIHTGGKGQMKCR